MGIFASFSLIAICQASFLGFREFSVFEEACLEAEWDEGSTGGSLDSRIQQHTIIIFGKKGAIRGETGSQRHFQFQNDDAIKL